MINNYNYSSENMYFEIKMKINKYVGINKKIWYYTYKCIGDRFL